MSEKCGATYTTIWKDVIVCTRNKGHHGDHTAPRLLPYTSHYYWKSNAFFNKELYCGKSFAGGSYRCERKPGHKAWHKSWVLNRYITWKEA